MITLDAHSVAQSLGGQVAGLNRIQCPGPNHSRRDRSLSVWIEPDAPDGFRVYSHAGDDALVCKDYIRAQLGMSPWRAGANSKSDWSAPPPRKVTADDNGVELARYLWKIRQPLEGSVAEPYGRRMSDILSENTSPQAFPFRPCPFPAPLTNAASRPAQIPSCAVEWPCHPSLKLLGRLRLGDTKGRRVYQIQPRTPRRLLPSVRRSEDPLHNRQARR